MPEGPPRLPTNSSSSLACSTTSGGCSLHRAGNWELSTLPERAPSETPGPRPSGGEPGGGVGTALSSGWASEGTSLHESGFQKGHLLEGSAQEKLGVGNVATLWSGKGLCGSPRSAEAGPEEGSVVTRAERG